jgi:tetratricopeptide (TPR) repeat protein
MKSERRHELATNELADWIANFPNWFKENMTTVIIAVVVVAALIAYTIFFYTREGKVWNEKNAMVTQTLDQLGAQKQMIVQGQTKNLGASDVLMTTASALESSAKETDNDVLSALAIIKRAEALRTETHYRATMAEPDVRKFQIQQAKTLYEEALAKAKSDPQVAAMAQFGIGLSLEDMRDFGGAKEAYQKIVNDPNYKGTTYQSRAEVRINTMSDNMKQVVFAKSVKPQTPETPEIKTPSLKLEEPITDLNQISAPNNSKSK